MSMSKVSTVISSIVVVAALAVGGYWLLQRTETNTCRICQREIHAEARAVMKVDGKREPICCSRCLLTFVHQQAQPARLVEVTDYVSRRPLSPDNAYYVEGSRVILCEKHEPMLDQTKQTYHRVFDRCEPSVYAFARREDAEAFAAGNGGMVRRLPQLLQEVEPRP